MNILIVHYKLISHFPPVQSLIRVLLKGGHNVTVITFEDEFYSFESKQGLAYKYILRPRKKKPNILMRILAYPMRLRRLRQMVRREMEHNDILWTTTDSTVRALGRGVYRYKHVMQLMELIEDIPVVSLPLLDHIGLNIKRFARRAYKVVVPEYNRAHIQKVWWGLRELPTVLPNKPFDDDFSEMEIPENVQRILDELDREEKKIILYQGGFYEDRDLESFAKAIEKDNDYRLYLMGKDAAYRTQLCQQYPDIKYIPYISPPFHLFVTSKAYVGLLPYKAAIVDHYSVLNALYCAPNKIYEYAKFGVPMLGTDVPGLNTPFKIYDVGYTCALEPEEIREKIRMIEQRHDTMSKNCMAFYESVDLGSIVESIIGEDSPN